MEQRYAHLYAAAARSTTAEYKIANAPTLDLLSEQVEAHVRNSNCPKLMKLDKFSAVSTTIGPGNGVDLESINK